MRYFGLVIIALLALLPFGVLGHGGGLAGLGCHHNRKAEGYHCHRGPMAGQSFGSKAEAERALRRSSEPAPTTLRTVPGEDRKAPVPTVAIPYDRGLYRHWIDEDRDCQNTRQEVLIKESTVQVTLDPRGCKVVAGLWDDPYTGRVFTDPGLLDIDHLIPLAEVHRSGGDKWDSTLRRAYANDLTEPKNLIAVFRSANRSIGDRDPANWMPPNASYHCEYVATWTSVKERWGLSADDAEREAVRRVSDVTSFVPHRFTQRHLCPGHRSLRHRRGKSCEPRSRPLGERSSVRTEEQLHCDPKRTFGTSACWTQWMGLFRLELVEVVPI